MKPGFDLEQFQLGINRRTFLGRAAYGLGGIALATLLQPKLVGSAQAAEAEQKWTGLIHPLHFPPRAKRIIHLCMAGGPSHLESLDPRAAPARERLEEQLGHELARKLVFALAPHRPGRRAA